MQRRHFNQALILSAGLASLSTQAASYEEGKHFQTLPKPLPVNVNDGQIEVLEFFAYSCIHCFRFDAPFENWKANQAADVVVKRIPVVFSEQFIPMAKLYYSLEGLGWLDLYHSRIFAAIHVQEKRLYTDVAINNWLKEQGADMSAFNKMYTSFGVNGKVKRGSQLSTEFLVEGTPALGIQGRFTIPGQGEQTLAVADQLIADLRNK